jgi:hypothetical protein
MAGPNGDAPPSAGRDVSIDRRLDDRLLDAFERLRAAEERRREAPVASDEFRMREREVEVRARELFEAAIWDEERTPLSDEPEVSPEHGFRHH